MLFNGTCERSTCLGTSDGYSTSFSLKALPDSDYFVAVSGRERGNEFQVDLEALECIQNDSCEMARSYSSFPIIDRTTNEFAAPLHRSGFPRDARGTWYKLEGDGTCVTVSMWGEITSYISVHEGVDCRALRSVTQESDGNEVKFRTSAGVSTFWSKQLIDLVCRSPHPPRFSVCVHSFCRKRIR